MDITDADLGISPNVTPGPTPITDADLGIGDTSPVESSDQLAMRARLLSRKPPELDDVVPRMQFVPRSAHSLGKIESATNADQGFEAEQIRALVERLRAKKGQAPLVSAATTIRPTDTPAEIAAAFVANHGGTPEQALKAIAGIKAQPVNPTDGPETPMEKIDRLRKAMAIQPIPDGYLPEMGLGSRLLESVSRGSGRDVATMAGALPALGEQALTGLGVDAPTPFSDALRDLAQADQADQTVNDLTFQKPGHMVKALDSAARSAPSSLITLPLGAEGLVAKVAGKFGLNLAASTVAKETARQVAIRSAAMAVPGGLVSAGQSVGQDLADGGYSPLAIVGRGILQGALEAGGEALPVAGRFGGEAIFVKRLMAAAEKRGLGQALKKALIEAPPELVAQGVQEGITSFAQSIAGDATNKNSVSFSDMIANASEQAIDGALSGMMMGMGFQAPHLVKAGASDVADNMAMRKALAEIGNAPIDQQAAQAAAMEPGRAPEAPGLVPIDMQRQQPQGQPVVQAGMVPVAQASAEFDAPAAPVDPTTYDPAATAQQAEQDATAAAAQPVALPVSEGQPGMPPALPLPAANASPAQGLLAAKAQKPAKGAKPATPAPAQANGDWSLFDPQETLGVPRASMPQVRGADRPELLAWLKTQGVRTNTETVDPATLKPTQAEFAPSKVKQAVQEAAAAKAAGKPTRPVMVSSDGYVIDGHHQWLAAKEAGEQVPVIRLGVPAAQALQTIKRFPKAGRAGGAEGPATTRQTPGQPAATPQQQGSNASAPVASAPVARQQPAPPQAGTPVAAGQSEAKPVVSGEATAGTTQPAEPAAAANAVAGDSTIIDVPGGQDMPATYEVRELDSLVASGDYSTGSVTKNGKYPADLQPRDYAPGNTEDVKVQSFAQGQKPGYYINTDPSASNGPPTVTANGTVLNGNGRTMSLQLAASRGDMGWYRRELDRLASVFGLDPESYKGMRQPVLVRVVKIDPTSAAAQRFARQGNVSNTQAQSPARTAASLGNLVDQGVLDTIDLEDEATTFSEAVSGPAGKDFRQALASALPAQEVPRYLNEQTGQLTEAGKELVRDLLLTKQLPVELIERMREDRKAMLRSLEQAVPQLMRLEGVVPESRVNEHLTEALEWISSHPEVTLPTQLVDSVDTSGKATQQDLTGRDDGMSPEARMLAEWLLKTGQAGKSSKPGLVSLIRGLEGRSSPILGDVRSGGQIAADALGVPIAPGAEFGITATAEGGRGATMSFRKDDDSGGGVESAQLHDAILAAMPGSPEAKILPDGPFGLQVTTKGGKHTVKVRVAMPQDFERLNAEERRAAAEAGREPEILSPENINGWAENGRIYLVPGAATKFTYNHELTHVLVNMGVLTRAEVEKLAKLAEKVLPPLEVSSIKRAYRGASSGLMAEEMAAHAIEAMAGKKARPPFIDRVLAWLKDMAALLKLTTQSDYGLAKDVASGRILDKRDVNVVSGNDGQLSRRIDAPGQQSLFGEQQPAPKPEPKAKPEPKPEPSAAERAVEKLAATVDKLVASQSTLFDLLAKAQTAASPPAADADTQAGGPSREGRGAGATGTRSGAGQRSDADAAGAGASGRDGGRAEGGSPGDDGRGTRGADGNGAGSGRADEQRDGSRSGQVDDGKRDERSAPDQAPAVERPTAIRPTGFRYQTVEDAMPPRGDITRVRANLDAIKAYQAAAREGRAATAEEREAIAKFSGWGSLKWVFNPRTANSPEKSRRELYHDAMKIMAAEDRQNAEAMNDEADEATTPPEDGETRQRAIVSTLNAHYTHPQVVADTWQMVEGMLGDRIPMGLRALEPSVGMGAFIGLEPMSMRGRTAWSAVELEPLTAGMFSKVYTDVATVQMGYEQLSVPDNSYDLVISNFPFGSYRPFDRRYTKVGKPFIHDYFFLKSIDKVRPGGLVVGITSTGTLDKPDDTVRKAIYEQADLVHAVRFPANAHETAGTAVVTDLLIFRKRMPGEKPGKADWLNVGKVPDAKGGSPIPMNEHFVRNQSLVLGTVERSGQLHGTEANGEKRPNVVKRDTYQQELDAAKASAPRNIVPKRLAGESRLTTIPAPADLKPGSIVGKDGKLWQKQGAELVLIDGGATGANKAERANWMRTMIANLRSIWKAELNGSDAAAERAVMNRTYDGGVKKFGPLNDRRNLSVFAADPDAPNLMALESLKSDENDEENQVWGKGPSFEKAMLRPQTVMGRAENGTQGVTQSLSMTGGVDPDTVAKAMGVSKDEATTAMRSEGAAYEDPVQGWQARWVYLSGNVKAKLAEAREAANRDPERYQANVDALIKVQPRDREANEITPTLGASWVPDGVFHRFMADRVPGVKVMRGAEGRWIVSGRPTDTANATWSVKGAHRTAEANEIVAAAINGSAVRMAGEDKDGKTLPDVDADRAAAEKANAMREAFMDWIRLPEQSRLMVDTVKAYNDVVNVYHREVADDSWLTFDGMIEKFTSDPQRRRSVARALTEGRLFLAHDVGTGKTVSLTAIAIESKRLGLSKKPVIATLNNVVAQFGRDALEAYPGKNILIQPAEWGEVGTPTSRSAFMSRLATQDYDVAIISHETLTGIQNDPKAEAAHMRDKLVELEAAKEEAKKNGDGSMSAKRAVSALGKRIENLRAGMLELQAHVLKRDHITFEEMGIDQLLIDEAHQSKNLGIITAQEKILGLGGGDSTRAEDLLIKTKALHARNGGERGLIMATGTPISNSMVEVFAFQSMMQPAAMNAAMVNHFDDWSRAFGTTKQSNEVQADGTRKSVTRYANWVNVHGLASMLREFMDVAFTSDIPRVWDALPDMREIPVKVPLTDRQRAYREFIGERLDAIKRQGKPFKGMDIGLVAMRDAMLSSIDMRLVDPKATAADGSKLPAAIAGIADLYRNGAKIGTKFPTQFVFQNIQSNPNAWGFNLNTELVKGLIAAGIPANRIAVLDGNVSKAKRNRIKAEAKAGKYAVLIGNTEVLGTGTNAQDYALATWHMDVPYRPADIIQRDGRMRRQGNKYAPKRKDRKVLAPGTDVLAHRVITEGTLDEALWARVGLKSEFINRMLGAVATNTDDSTMREVETEGMDPEMIAALASGDQDLIRAVELEEEVGRLRRERSGHYNQRDYLNSQARTYDGTAQMYEESHAVLAGHAATVDGKIPEKAHLDDGTDSKALDQRMVALQAKSNNSYTTDIKEPIGQYAGLPVVAIGVRRHTNLAFNGKVWVDDTTFDAIVQYGSDSISIDLKEGAGAALLGQLKQKAKGLAPRAEQQKTEAEKFRKWATANREKADAVGVWPKEAEYAAKATELKAVNEVIRAKPRMASSLSGEARMDFRGGMWAREAEKARKAAEKADRAKAKASAGPKLSRRIVSMTEEATTPEREIVNPIDPSLSPEQKAAELAMMTVENRKVVAGIVQKARAMGLMEAKDNVKTTANVVKKASRPSILAEKPWHQVEHIRDSYRFKLPVKTLQQMEDMLNLLLDAGISIVKYDSAKLFNPKKWGWRFVGMDLRMPNGQLVEVYIPFESMDSDAIKGPNHHLFEKWRNVDQKDLDQNQNMMAEYQADVKESRARYDEAFAEGLAASGMDEAAAKAAFNSIEDRIGSRISPNRSISSSADGAAPRRDQDLPPSLDSSVRYSVPQATSTPLSSSRTSMTRPSEADNSGRDGDAMSDVRTPKMSRRINVDGKQRPADNADGKPIAQTDDAIRRFWRWFGDSKVVDEQGRPLVVYHGSLNSFRSFDPATRGTFTWAKSAQKAFFFSSKRAVAETYGTAQAAKMGKANKDVAEAEAIIRRLGEDPNRAEWKMTTGKYDGTEILAQIEAALDRRSEAFAAMESASDDLFADTSFVGTMYPVYLKISNPREADGDRVINDTVTAAMETGHDGAVIRGAVDAYGGMDEDKDAASDIYAVFDPKQIKSAEGNDGGFNDSTPDIFLSRRIGRPDLANPGTTGPVRGMMDQVDEARNQAGQPERKPDQERENEAEARFKADPEGERRKLMAKYRNGEFTDDVETRLAHHLINRDGLRAITTRSADEMMAATKLMALYRQNGSDAARAFRARADRSASPEERLNVMIQAILTPPAEVLQQVRNAYENGKPQEAEAIMRKHAEEAQKVLDILKAQGIDPNDLTLPGKLVDPVVMARVVRTISGLRGKAGWGDVALEYWINAILSGPYTHVVNTVGNAASAGWDMTVQRWAEIAVGMATNADGKARAGELLPMYKAMFTALPKAAKNMMRSFQAEHDVFEWEVNGVPVAGGTSGSKIEDRAAIKGTKGRIIRSATRALTAADSFWKTFIGHGQAAAEAYRTGVDRGLSGAALDAHMASDLADYGSKSWHNALGFAQEMTFQQDGGQILKAIQNVRNITGPGGLKPMAFVLPFTRTPWNIMATGIRKTPLGSAALAYRLGKEGFRRSFDKDNADGAYAGRDAVRHAAEQALAWGLMLALAALVYDRDEKDRPMITGTGEGYGGDRGKRELEGRTNPPLSIRVGNQWYSYNRIEPAATALGMIVDMLEFKRDGGDASTMIGKTGGVLMEQVRNKTFLQGVSDLMNAVEDPERFASRYTANFASSWMPNIIRQPLRGTQEFMPEGKPLASEAGESSVGLWLRSVGRAMVPIESFGAPPKIDVWGRDIPRTAQQNSSWLSRMSESLTWPLPRKLDRGTELDLVVKSYNEAHPDEAWWPSIPAAYYKVNGKRVDMTERQYNEFLRERGRMAVQQLGWMRWDPKNPPQANHIDMIQKALRRATTIAKAKVLNDASADAYKQANNPLSPEEKLDEQAKR